jgi:hypothetical protein
MRYNLAIALIRLAIRLLPSERNTMSFPVKMKWLDLRTVPNRIRVTVGGNN